MDNSKKRKSEAPTEHTENKKAKKQWRPPKKGQQSAAPTIEPGDAGIWATCEMHKEGKCTSELRDVFNEYAAKIYKDVPSQNETADEDVARSDGDQSEAEADIEAEISKEVKDMNSKSTKRAALFQAVRVDVQCVLFFKTKLPVEPVSFVHGLCQDAAQGKAIRRSRFVKRLTPMSRMGKASVGGMEEVAQAVLRPVFHVEGGVPKKFAIKPTIRNHSTLKRDDIIKQIATMVGQGHSVDLKNYDYLILVDIYKVCPHAPLGCGGSLDCSFMLIVGRMYLE